MKKRILWMLCIFLCCLDVFTCTGMAMESQAEEADNVTRMKEKAVEWIVKQQNEDGSFGDNRLILDTCNVTEVLRREEMPAGEEWLFGQKENILQTGNEDPLSRYAAATREWEVLTSLAEGKNEDGGYGLTVKYRSDILDSVLAWRAYVQEAAETGSLRSEAEELIKYLEGSQKASGGFAYPKEESIDVFLSGEVGVGLALCQRCGIALATESLLEKMEVYINNIEANPEHPEEFGAWSYGELYRMLKNRKCDTKKTEDMLQSLQKEDGSFYGTLMDTLIAVRLLQVMEDNNKPYLELERMETELSSYTLFTGKSTEIQVTSHIRYETNAERAGVWRVTGVCDGEVVFMKESPVVFKADGAESILETAGRMTGYEDKTQSIQIELLIEEVPVITQEETLHSEELVVGSLKLAGEQSGTDEVTLNWNDLSNEYCRYGYRVYRKTENGAWESRSTWDGEENVNVLNIYPCEQVKDLLPRWMEQPLSEEGVPAGKGLFTIDTVSIDAYNLHPETYLIDENGEYRYDVLVFGIYNQNGAKDLSKKGYEATQAFVDAGRGVLFGHDTVTLHGPAYHPNFSLFADQLGCKVVTGGGWYQTHYAKVVRSGYVTGYPWKIEGRLTIPLTHSTMQFTGGTLDATVWLELEGNYFTDSETGGKTNAYLFTKNQLAMIQTGDNVDMPTDDERKVLANTLFYLKQLSSDTRIVDKGAYDGKAPKESIVEEVEQHEDTFTIRMHAEDEGTIYEYYVEAVPQGIEEEELRRTSERIEIRSVSGIQGFFVWTGEEEEAIFVPAGNGTAETTLAFPQGEDTCQVFVKAVDKSGKEGNVCTYAVEKQQQTSFADTGVIYAERNLTIGCSQTAITGNVEAGGEMTFYGSRIIIDGDCHAGGTIQAYVAELEAGNRMEKIEVATKEEVFQKESFSEKGCEQTESLHIYNSYAIETPTFSQEDVCMYGTTMHVGDRLLAQGDIRMSAAEIVLNGDILSRSGDIHIQSSSLLGNGTIQAPEGTVYLYVSRLDLWGGIFAGNITIQASDVKIVCEP